MLQFGGSAADRTCGCGLKFRQKGSILQGRSKVFYMAFGKKKGFDYFECFGEVAVIAKNSADYLYGALSSFDFSKVKEYAAEMHEHENNADAKKHELNAHLLHEFMPPIDREDITLLAQELDNMVDQIEDVMRRIYMFNISSIRHEAIEFAGLIVDACETFGKLSGELPNFKKSKTIRESIIGINTIENKGDKLHSDSVRRLFTDEEASPADKLAWTMIFESLENTLDSCEHAADVIDNIITKNT